MTHKTENTTEEEKITFNSVKGTVVKSPESKRIWINKTVTKNFIVDIIAGVQNLFGLNLIGYEKMVNKGMKQIEKETKDLEMKWYRYEITQMTNGALSITFYGEAENGN